MAHIDGHAGACRGDHQLKQLPVWSLTQPEPGMFRWTTPAGRTYTTRPDQPTSAR
jgi:hypothetical protein